MSASGLSSPKVCPDVNTKFSVADLLAVFPQGIATDSIPVDPTTQKISQAALQSYLNSKISSGAIPKPSSPGEDMSAKSASDAAFHNKIQDEYCFYEARYIYSMKKFLELSTSMDVKDVPEAKNMLTVSKSLNSKLNSILELLGLLSDSRTDSTNSLKSRIASSNSIITSTSNQIKKQNTLLSRDDAVLETQRQMIKYTKEKNDHVSNQIALFTILNAFAIGSIFAIVRQV
jgi:hypothetical protein